MLVSEINRFLCRIIRTTKNKSTRIKYNMCAAPTGRLSSGGAKKNTYFMDYNIQAVPRKRKKNSLCIPHPTIGLCLKKEGRKEL